VSVTPAAVSPVVGEPVTAELVLRALSTTPDVPGDASTVPVALEAAVVAVLAASTEPGLVVVSTTPLVGSGAVTESVA
jgi:hypothetical protein